MRRQPRPDHILRINRNQGPIRLNDWLNSNEILTTLAQVVLTLRTIRPLGMMRRV